MAPYNNCFLHKNFHYKLQCVVQICSANNKVIIHTLYKLQISRVRQIFQPDFLDPELWSPNLWTSIFGPWSLDLDLWTSMFGPRSLDLDLLTPIFEPDF